MLRQYIRDGVYSLDAVLPYVEWPTRENRDLLTFYNNKPTRLNSTRLHTFKISNVCAYCGVVGVYFCLEMDRSQLGIASTWHFNLYGLQDGKEILMTKDHIYPVSKGGRSYKNNLQTLCVMCNSNKGDR